MARKAKKAAKEVAAKQAANAPVVSKPQDVIVKVNKDPVLVTTVLKLIPEKSNISKWLTMGTSVEEPPNSEAEDLLVVEKVES